jgi:hypothetical protein
MKSNSGTVNRCADVTHRHRSPSVAHVQREHALACQLSTRPECMRCVRSTGCVHMGGLRGAEQLVSTSRQSKVRPVGIPGANEHSALVSTAISHDRDHRGGRWRRRVVGVDGHEGASGSCRADTGRVGVADPPPKAVFNDSPAGGGPPACRTRSWQHSIREPRLVSALRPGCRDDT